MIQDLSIFTRYKENLIEKIKGNNFEFDFPNRLCNKLHKITLNLITLKTRKATINLKKMKNVLNIPYQLIASSKIPDHTERISNLNCFC